MAKHNMNIDEVEQNEIVNQEESSLAIPETASSVNAGIQGEFSLSDYQIPYINIRQMTGKYAENGCGNFCDLILQDVIIGQFDAQGKPRAGIKQPLEITVLSMAKVFEERVVYGSGVYGRRYSSEAEYLKDGLTKMQISEKANILALVKRPTELNGVEDWELDNLFTMEIGEDCYALVNIQPKDVGYNKTAKPIFTAFMQNGIPLGKLSEKQIGLTFLLGTSREESSNKAKYGVFNAVFKKTSPEEQANKIAKFKECPIVQGLLG